MLSKRTRIGVVGCELLCIWLGNVSTAKAYQLVGSALERNDKVDLMAKVRKITRVQTTAVSRTRFDIFCEDGWLQPIFAALKEARRNSVGASVWHVKVHTAYSKRVKARGSVARLSDVNVVYSEALCASFNITGVDNKATELSALAVPEVKVLLLQETLREPTAWPCRIPGFTVVGERYMEGTGKRGVMVAVRDGLAAAPMEPSGPFVQWAQVFLGVKMFLFGSVYLPSGKGARRNVAKQAVKASIVALVRKFPGSPIVLGGDFNCGFDMLQKLVQQWGVGLQILRGHEGENMVSWRRTNSVSQVTKSSLLDHFLVNVAAVETMRVRGEGKLVSVERSWNPGMKCDHWPIGAWFTVTSIPVTPRPRLARVPKIDPYKVRECGPALADHAAFAELSLSFAERLSAIDGFVTDKMAAMRDLIDEVSVSLHAATLRAVENLDLKVTVRPEGRRFPSSYLPRGLARKIRAKGLAIMLLQSLLTKAAEASDASTVEVEVAEAKDKVTRLSKEIRCSIRGLNASRQLKSVMEGTDRFLKGTKRDDTSRMPLKKRLFWDWVRRFTEGTGPRNRTLQPILGDDGELKFAPDDIEDAWHSHFEKLASDLSGVDLSDAEWEVRFSALPSLSILPGINAALTWSELRKVLTSMTNWKSGGGSGIIMELFKYTIKDEEDNEDSTPSPLRQILLGVLQAMLDTAHMAKNLCDAELVTIPKKGDLSLRDNYRGISLIESLAKVLLTIVARRISTALESTGRLIKAQAGFRRDEEMLANVITLHDLCLLRKRSGGKKTYICFLDFTKAYDRVIHKACLLKAKKIGVQGASLDLLTHVYGTSMVKLQGSGAPAFLLRRGLRQGCPASPDLFLIAINDFLDGQEGVALPGCKMVVDGLLGADDACLVSGSLEGMRTALQCADTWAALNGMSFGLSKCCLMCVGPDSEAEVNMSELRDAGLTLGNGKVPVAGSYCYLGVNFQSDLSLQSAVADRVIKAKGSLVRVKPILADVRIPLAMRRLTLLTHVQPTLTYGGELLGMRSVALTHPLQEVMSKALESVSRGKGPYSVRASPAAVMLEFGLPPVHACVAGLRARSYAKFGNAQTHVASLYKSSCKFGWVGSSERWLITNAPSLDVFNKLCVKDLERIGRAGFTSYKEVPSAVLSRKVKWVTAEKCWAACTDETMKRYINCGFRATSGYIRQTAEWGTKLSRGFQRIFQMRCGSFMTGRHASKTGGLPTLGTHCFCCKKVVYPRGETINHLLLNCEEWAVERSTLLVPLLDAIREATTNANVQATRKEKVTLLLGGRVKVLGANGVVTSLGLKDWSTSEHGTPLCLYLAKFLCAIESKRIRLLRKVHKCKASTVEDDILLQDIDLGATVAPARMRSRSPSLDPLLMDHDQDVPRSHSPLLDPLLI